MYLNDPLDVSIVWEARLLGVIRFLKSNGSYELEGSDLAFAELIYSSQGELGATPVVSDGILFKFKDPVFSRAEAKIVKVDKRQNNMLVEFKLDGKTSKVWMKSTLAEPAESTTGEEIIREVESVDDPVWELTTF